MDLREAIDLFEMTSDPSRDEVVASAAKQLGIPTLEVRGRDALDFHDIVALRKVLEAVYEAGRAANRPTM